MSPPNSKCDSPGSQALQRQTVIGDQTVGQRPCFDGGANSLSQLLLPLLATAHSRSQQQTGVSLRRLLKYVNKTRP
jgi:hypothetical protein